MSIKMENSDIEVESLIKKLEDILTILDDIGLAIPAMKVEEAIAALKQADTASPKL